MDATVQFLRNALCTMKNFNILGGSFLHDPNITSRYYALPSPLDQTTPLEFLIAITQLYAFASLSLAGCKMITQLGISKLHLINRLVDLQSEQVKEDEKDKKKDDNGKIEAIARKIVAASLLQESDAASRSVFVGANVLVVGIAFFWLFANSLHSTEWIGGVVGLIHALTAMEISLLVFLYYMIKDADSAFCRSSRARIFSGVVASSGLQAENITVECYCWLVDGWTPFWADVSSGSTMAEEKMLKKEEETIAFRLAEFSEGIDKDKVNRIQVQARISLLEGYRECMYLILNFFAFYGYLVCIVVFYYDDEGNQPDYIRSMLLWMPNGDADWLGNAMGDFMWTVEPLIILGSPMVIKSMSLKETKEKLE